MNANKEDGGEVDGGIEFRVEMRLSMERAEYQEKQKKGERKKNFVGADD